MVGLEIYLPRLKLWKQEFPAIWAMDTGIVTYVLLKHNVEDPKFAHNLKG
jgi:hypothetical protein